MDDHISRLIDQTARSQHGLLHRDQALALLGPHRARRWTEDGRLVRAQPRVLRLAGAPVTPQQQMLAASLACRGPVSHRSAAWVWNLLDAQAVVDVSVRHPRRACLWDPAVVHRIRDLTDRHVVERDGMSVTSPARTILDLGLVVPWWVVDRALGRALARRLLPLSEVRTLREDLARRGRNGTGVTQQVLDERVLRGGGGDSALEARFLGLLRRFGLPAPVLQHEVWDGGRFVARVDAAYPERRIAIEIDGYEFHSSPDAFQRDRARQNDLVRLGWRVLRFTAADVLRNPQIVPATLHPVL
jgi:hypothetical protein